MRPIWLDLELREDIDDYLTLVYALENNVDIAAISINNPSKLELKLTKCALEKFGKDVPVFITGELTSYPNGKDISASLMTDKVEKACMPSYYELPLDSDKIPAEDFLFFCGGSLTTLSIIIEYRPNVTACVQGGFASYEIVPESALLKKFKNRDKVPTWNLNLDMDSTERVLAAKTSINFVSKNICHAAFVGLADIKSSDSYMGEVLTNYLSGSKYKDKCLHDLLAFLTIFDSELATFKSVDLLRTDDERPKWWSKTNLESNHNISVSYDRERFLSLVKNGL